jgi:hypothetical protein
MTENEALNMETVADGNNPLTEEFGELVKKTLYEWKVPGMSIAVVDGENTYMKVCPPHLPDERAHS